MYTLSQRLPGPGDVAQYRIFAREMADWALEHCQSCPLRETCEQNADQVESCMRRYVHRQNRLLPVSVFTNEEIF